MPSLPPLRLNELLEIADDLAMDFPKLWPYLAEILSPVFAHAALPLSTLAQAPPELVSHVQYSTTFVKYKPYYYALKRSRTRDTVKHMHVHRSFLLRYYIH